MSLKKILMLFRDGTYVRIYNQMSGKTVAVCTRLRDINDILKMYVEITKDKRMCVNEIVPLHHAEELYIVTL